MPPDPDAAAAISPSATDPPEASARPSASDYAPVAHRRSVRRWMARHPAVMALLALAVAAAIAWYGWNWQLQKDEREFAACATAWKSIAAFTFKHPPTRGALRHLARLPGRFYIACYWPGTEAGEGAAAFAAVSLPNVASIGVGLDVDADSLVKVLARPDSGWRAVTTLDLDSTQVTDAALKELARPDCGVRALTNLGLRLTQVTDAGLWELARPDCGLKALTTLVLRDFPVTGAGLKALARPDSGLKALTTLSLSGNSVTNAGLRELARPEAGLKSLTLPYLTETRVTDAGIAELQKARPGLTISR